jgi:death on curing protein
MELSRYGGLAGVRDRALLESAIARPIATFGGETLHADLFEMAAAYFYHIVRNHPFLDGNKRTGLIVALTFLAMNGIPIPPAAEEFYDTTIGVAEGRIAKPDLTAFLRRSATPRP